VPDSTVDTAISLRKVRHLRFFVKEWQKAAVFGRAGATTLGKNYKYHPVRPGVGV
jgi:hypothetical protein